MTAKIYQGGGKNLKGGGKWGRRGREVGEKGEGSGGEGGGKWGERGRELGMGYPPVHPLTTIGERKIASKFFCLTSESSPATSHCLVPLNGHQCVS